MLPYYSIDLLFSCDSSTFNFMIYIVYIFLLGISFAQPEL